MRIVLASASPRRIELLKRIVSDFDVISSAAEEPLDGRPARRVLEAARRKAVDVAARADGLVVAADTVVALQGHVLGKPESREAAAAMLRHLRGHTHRVLTGVCLIDTVRHAQRKAVERTLVHFRPLSEREIERYLDSGEYADKAGAYAIQGRAAAFVDRIRGDYTNVMGLPVARLTLLLRDLGADV
jgi:septum formation protein